MSNVPFVPNANDEIHCMQACYAMTINALLGEQTDSIDVEFESGFRPGHRSWPFASICSWAKRGLAVWTLDLFEADRFAADPVREVQSWFSPDDPEGQRLVHESELEKEGSRVREALATGNVRFEKRVPTVDDLSELADWPETALIARVNHRVLMGRDGVYGHFVIVYKVDDEHIWVQDPGPPSRPEFAYEREVFLRAWQYPSPQAAELIVVGDAANRRLSAGTSQTS